VFGAFMTIIAAIMNVATAAVLGRMLFFSEMNLTLDTGTTKFEVPYLQLALVAVPVLILANIFSARYRPNNWFFRWVLDFIPSVGLLLVVMGVIGLSLFVWPAPLGLLLLAAGLLVWSLFDVFWNQQSNVGELISDPAPAGV